MSYIRSGSNPEKLYIWGDGENACIAEGSKDVWTIPIQTFNSFIRKFHRRSHDYPCQHKGVEIKEVWVDGNGLAWNSEETLDSHLKRLECKVQLSYETHSVIMWDVTWEYIVYSNIERLK